MKKIILSIVVLIFSTTLIQAQWFGNRIKGNGILSTKSRTVADYDKISVAGAFNVTLIHGEEGELSIKMEENLHQYLITEVKGDKLIIRWKKGVNISTRRGVHIIVPFENIDQVDLLGSGDIIADDVIKTSHFSTLLSGSGDIILNVDAKTVSAKVTGSGNIQLLGNTHNFNALVTGSGGIQSYKMMSEDVVAKITGSGDIGLFVSNDLDAKVIGSGDIIYKGNPETQHIKVLGSGDVVAK